MKRIYAFSLMLTLLTLLGFRANAEVSVTIDCATPQLLADKGEIGSMDFEEVAVSTTETSQTFTFDSTWGTLRLWPADGYYFTSITTSGGETITPITALNPGTFHFSQNKINGVAINLKTYNGQTITVEVAEVERNSTFTVEIENGLANITSAEFDSGYAPKLVQGENNIKFNPQVDGKFNIQFAKYTPAEGEEDVPYPYLITLDDEPASEKYDADLLLVNSYSHLYRVANPENAYLYVQVFQDSAHELEQFNLTIEYGEGMEGCLSNIMNTTDGKMTMPDEFENGIITGLTDIVDGSVLKLNFRSEDHTITKVLVNGIDKTSALTNEGDNINQQFVLTLTENTTVKIEGNATQWADITYTGYISNPESVVYALNATSSYDLSYTVGADVSGRKFSVKDVVNGAETSVDIIMPEGSKEITLTVSEKNNQGAFVFKPADGWFITKLFTGTDMTRQVNEMIKHSLDGTTFVMLTEQLSPLYTADVEVHPEYPQITYIKGSAEYEQNGNPDPIKESITGSLKSLSFHGNYANPFMISLNQNESGHIYVDGAEVEGKPNESSNGTDFTFELYYPEDGETSDLHSKLLIYLQPSGATMSGASLTLENGAEADFYYSPIMHKANPEGQAVVAGTLMTVKPSSANATVVFKGEVQTLDENGEFRFEATGAAADNVVTVTIPKPITLKGMVPESGTTVKKLAGVTLIIPMTDGTDEITLEPVIDVLNQTTITLSGETITTIQQITGLDDIELSQDDNGNLLCPIKFAEPVTTEGKNYYVKVPEGAFVQKEWDSTKEEFVKVIGGYASKAFSGRFSIDPTMKSPLENYTLAPATGESVGEISTVTLSFPDLAVNTQLSSWEFPNATFTSGAKTVNAIVSLDWSAEDYLTFTIKPIDESEEIAAITEAGEWTLNLEAGAIKTSDEETPQITATYTVEGPYTVTPAAGTVKSLSNISIKFNGISAIEEVEGAAAITLVGPEYNESPVASGVGTATFTLNLSFKSPTEDGDYTLTIPAGTVKLDGEDNSEITINYTFKKGWQLTPTPGSTVESLNEFVLTFTEATTAEYVGSQTSFALGNSTNTYGAPGYVCEEIEGAEHPSFKLTLLSTAQKPSNGDYTFRIDDGTFKVDGEDSPEISAEYVLDAEVTADYIISPDGKVLPTDWGINLALIFDEAATVTTPDASKVTFKYDDEEIPSSAVQIMAEQNYLMFMIEGQQYYQPGTITLEIPAGAFKVGKEDSPAVSATWQVVEPKTFEVDIEAGKGNQLDTSMSDMSVLLIHFPEATTAEVFNEYGASLKTASGYTYSQTGKIEILTSPARKIRAEGGDGVTVKVTFDPAPTKQTDYIFSMREGTIILDGVYESPSIERTYTFDLTTGVIDIFTDEDGNVTVYTLDGKVVLDKVPGRQLRELNKGIYIINGKKTLVK